MASSSQALRALQAIDLLIQALAQELAPGDVRAGWTDEKRARWRSRMLAIRGEVAAGVKPSVNLDVALEHNGIHGAFDPVSTPVSWHVSQAADAIYDWR